MEETKNLVVDVSETLYYASEAHTLQAVADAVNRVLVSEINELMKSYNDDCSTTLTVVIHKVR